MPGNTRREPALGLSELNCATWVGALSELSYSRSYEDALRKAEFCKGYALALYEADDVDADGFRQMRDEIEAAWERASDEFERRGHGRLNTLMLDESPGRKRAVDRELRDDGQDGRIDNSDPKSR